MWDYGLSKHGGDPFWPAKNQSVIFWPVKFGQLFYANYIGPRGSQNLTGHLVFTYFDIGRSVSSEKQRLQDDLFNWS